MRWLSLSLATLLAGCHSGPAPLRHDSGMHGSAVVPAGAALGAALCSAPGDPSGPTDLAALWRLAVANNPELREAAAEVEAARGRQIQASKYPNPQVSYFHESLGNNIAPTGSIGFEVSQQIVTAGKRKLDMAIAARATETASLHLVGRKFEVLTRLRGAWYGYQGWLTQAEVNREVVAALEEGVAVTRRLVEEVKSRPRTDLLRLQALLEEARINLTASLVSVEASWRRVAAEVGLPHLPPPPASAGLPDAVPDFDADAVARRALSVHTELRAAAVEITRARLQVDRARAEAVPNVTVGGGWDRESVDLVSGALISVQTALPVWDHKEGQIRAARARWAQAQAAEASVATRLSRDIAEAFGRYRTARAQVEQGVREVLPRLAESLDLVRKGYQAGAASVSFADVLLSQQALNDARLRVASARRDLWRAVADLQGLMQLDVDEER